MLSGHVSDEVVRHSEIFPALRSRGLSVQRTVEVLADIGVFQDDRTPSFEQWLERKLEGIAPGIRRDVEHWARLLHDGGPRSQPRDEATVWGYLNRIRPVLLEWSVPYGHLREVTLDDVLTQLDALHGSQRRHTLIVLRSLFGRAKKSGTIFKNPTSRIRVGQHEYGILQPLEPEHVNNSVAAVAKPADRLVLALAAVHAARSGALEPVEQPGTDPVRVSPVVNGRDFSKTPYLNLVSDTVVPELQDKLGAIRAAMYSRLIGLPGEQYYLCCDESYFVHAIQQLAVARMRSQIAMLGVGNQVRSAAGASMLGVLPAMALTGSELVKSAAGVGLALDALNWAREHPTETIVIVTVVVVVSAALIVSAGAALLAVAAAEGVGGAALLGGATAAAETLGAAGAVAETTAIGVPASIMAQTPGAASVVAAAVPETALATGSTAGTSVASASAWARAVLSSAPTATELAEATMQKQIDELLVKAVVDAAAKKVIPATVAAIGGTAIVGFSASPAYAASSPSGTPASRSPDPLGALISTQTGRLFVVRVLRSLPYPITSPPGLYEKFNADRYADKTAQLQGPQPSLGEIRMLGILRVI